VCGEVDNFVEEFVGSEFCGENVEIMWINEY
jgi:hypothetical protein